jgi:hypothetical protein
MERRALLTICGLIAACGARSNLDVGADASVDLGGIPCGTAICDPATQLCARCDGPDDDGAYESLCIDIPESLPDWWGAWYPGCDHPVATFACTRNAHCGPSARCVGESTYTFCLDSDERIDFCDPRVGVTPTCTTASTCPPCAPTCAPPREDWPLSLCARAP